MNTPVQPRVITGRIRAAGGNLPVYALPTYADCHGAAVCVGHANSWTEAEQAIHHAGYRIMRTGGLADVVGQSGIENVLVAVHPPGNGPC